MPKRTQVVLGLLALLVAFSAVQAGDKVDRGPHRYLPEQDGNPVLTIDRATNTEWAVWAYRNGGEFDIALAQRCLNPDAGIATEWTEPVFLGLRDGISQTDPSVAADASGNLYLAYAQAGQVILTTLTAGNSTWAEPISISPGRRVMSPELQIVGDRLVIAFRHGADVELHTLPLLQEIYRGRTIQDAPDPVLSAPTSEGKRGGDDSSQDGGSGADLIPTDLEQGGSESNESEGDQVRP